VLRWLLYIFDFFGRFLSLAFASAW